MIKSRGAVAATTTVTGGDKDVVILVLCMSVNGREERNEAKTDGDATRPGAGNGSGTEVSRSDNKL